MCFFAVCVLVQLDLQHSPLFPLDYDIVYPYFPKPPQADETSEDGSEYDADSDADTASNNEGSSAAASHSSVDTLLGPYDLL